MEYVVAKVGEHVDAPLSWHETFEAARQRVDLLYRFIPVDTGWFHLIVNINGAILYQTNVIECTEEPRMAWPN